MFQIPHRHKIPLQATRREMTTKLCEKRKVIFWMMVESNIFSRAAERGIAREESRDTSLDAHGFCPWAWSGAAGRRSPEHSPGSWSCCVQGAHTQPQGEVRSAEVRWTLPGEEGSAGQGPTLAEESLADAKQGRGSCGCKVTHWKAFTEEFAGAICIKKIGSVLLSGGKETAVCVTATPH